MTAPGTKADQAIEYLRRAGSATAAEIARAIGIEPKNTVSSLQGAIDAGGIEVNLVSRPGQPPHKVYRLGPNANGWRAYKPPKPTIVPRPAVVEGSGVRVVAHKPAREAKPIQPARAAKAPAAQPKVARNVGSRSPELDTRPPPGDAAVAAGPPQAVPAAPSPTPARASVPTPAAAAALLVAAGHAGGARPTREQAETMARGLVEFADEVRRLKSVLRAIADYEDMAATALGSNAEVTGRPLADGPVDRRVGRHGEDR